MRTVIVTKRRLHQPEPPISRTPAESLGMVWRVTLDAWAFADPTYAECRLQRHIVVLKRRAG